MSNTNLIASHVSISMLAMGALKGTAPLKSCCQLSLETNDWCGETTWKVPCNKDLVCMRSLSRHRESKGVQCASPTWRALSSFEYRNCSRSGSSSGCTGHWALIGQMVDGAYLLTQSGVQSAAGPATIEVGNTAWLVTQWNVYCSHNTTKGHCHQKGLLWSSANRQLTIS